MTASQCSLHPGLLLDEPIHGVVEVVLGSLADRFVGDEDVLCQVVEEANPSGDQE